MDALTHRNFIYVFDFDCTITKSHTGGCVGGAEAITPSAIRANVKEGFVEVVRWLKRNGDAVYIATYGDDNFGSEVPNTVCGHALIKCYMDVLFGPEQTLFTLPERDASGQIVAHGTIIAAYSNDAKAYHLQQVASREGIDLSDRDSAQRIVLYDDDAINVAYWASQGCTTLDSDSPQRAGLIARDEGFCQMLLEACQRA